MLQSINGSNLLKHLIIHKTEYEEVKSLNMTQKGTTQTSINSETITKECTNLVTVHGRPLALLDDEAFQNIISLIPDCRAKVCSRKIRKNIIETAGSLRISMAQNLQAKLICIKVDVASLSLRSFMGINAQYLEEGTIVLKNLAMIELLERHTSEHLKEQVLFVLQRFRIGLDNIYSFTTDNGANMLKMGRLLNEQINLPNQRISTEDGNVSMENVSDQNDIEMEEQGADHRKGTENISMDSDSDFDYDADTGFDIDRQNQFTETITSSLSMQFHENTTQQRNIAIIRCAAHTLQLSVLEVCNSTLIKQVINDARKVAKQLRTQKYSAEIAKAGRNQSSLDCPTRWNSTVDMIQRLISLKDFCDNSHDSNLNLPETTWNTLQDYLTSLLPAKELSQILQHEQLTIGDFYLQWLLCKIKLKNINTFLCTLLINSMNNREQTLFANDAFLCAVFLDGRVNSTLTDEQRDTAKIKLLELHQHLQNLNSNKENEPNSSSTNSSSLSQTNTDPARVELDDFLGVKYVEAQSDVRTLLRRRTDNIEMPATAGAFRNLNEEITAFLNESLLKSTEDIIKYWENNKIKYPALYKLACVVLASPATQVSVERLFSSLKFVVSRYRFNLNRNLIEDIIFIRNNKIYEKH